MAKLINYRAQDGLGAFQNETPRALKIKYSVASILATEVVVPRPPVTTPTVLVGDMSFWQGATDFQKMKANGLRAIWIKVSQGLWVDSMFDTYLKGATDAGLDVGFYHFVDPNQSSVTPEDAARLCADLTSGVGNLSMWLDVERRGALTTTGLLNYAIRFWSEYLGRVERVAENYTRMSFWNENVTRSSYWRDNDIRLVAARYNLALTSPWSDNRYLPLDWDLGRYEFQGWQYSADGNGLGSYFGVSSNSLDLSLFYGTDADFDRVYKLSETPPTGDLESRVITLETKVADHEERLTALEQRVGYNETKIDELGKENDEQTSELSNHDVRITALEQSKPTPDDPLTIEITDQHKPSYFKDSDDRGKPIMIQVEPPLEVGSQFTVNNPLALHSRDNKATPTTLAADGRLYYRINEGPRRGRFVIADKAKEIN